MSKSRKKQKKRSQDASRCCAKCSFSSVDREGKTTCGLDAVEVEPDSCCARFGSEVEVHCQRCGKGMKFRDRVEYFSSRTIAKIETSGGSTAQGFTLCVDCQREAQAKFGELLDWMMAADRLT